MRTFYELNNCLSSLGYANSCASIPEIDTSQSDQQQYVLQSKEFVPKLTIEVDNCIIRTFYELNNYLSLIGDAFRSASIPVTDSSQSKADNRRKRRAHLDNLRNKKRKYSLNNAILCYFVKIIHLLPAFNIL